MFDRIDHRLRRGGSRREADGVFVTKPFAAQILRHLDMMHARTKLRAGFDEFMRVVAVRAADDHHQVAFSRKFGRRALTLFRRLTHGVDETHRVPHQVHHDRVRSRPVRKITHSLQEVSVGDAGGDDVERGRGEVPRGVHPVVYARAREQFAA